MNYNTLILGAGAAGMMCAARARGRTLIIDHARAPGEKIRISGGGRCNFTNTGAQPQNFICTNPHFHKSALARYTQFDFIDLIARHGIAYHEKTLGQLFCDNSARDVVAMLRAEMDAAGAVLWLQTSLIEVANRDGKFHATLEKDGKRHNVVADNLVLATGGKSIPKMGATGLAYEIATQFNHALVETRAGLVPFTFPEGRFAPLAGVAADVVATCGATQFREAALFTHRGMSGPAILQISSFWREGDEISLNFFPDGGILEALKARRQSDPRRQISTILGQLLPTRFADDVSKSLSLSGNMADKSDVALGALAHYLTNYRLTPSGSEGYRTAEVTLGGIDTDGLSSKTMMSKTLEGLYCIGEAVDVTGWLGGYNFQWAWSSGAAAAEAISAKIVKAE